MGWFSCLGRGANEPHTPELVSLWGFKIPCGDCRYPAEDAVFLLDWYRTCLRHNSFATSLIFLPIKVRRHQIPILQPVICPKSHPTRRLKPCDCPSNQRNHVLPCRLPWRPKRLPPKSAIPLNMDRSVWIPSVGLQGCNCKACTIWDLKMVVPPPKCGGLHLGVFLRGTPCWVV